MPVKWKQILLLVGILGLGAMSAVTCSSFEKSTREEDDERPPIIVKNGSIEFIAQAKDGTTGSWVKEGMTWRHHDPPRNGPKWLYVQVTTGSCLPNAEPYIHVESIDLGFTSSGVPGGLVIFALNKQFKVFVGNWPSNAVNEKLTIAPGTTTLTSATLFTNGSTAPVVCTPANGVLELKIFQKKN